jgi:hypothetical protein
MIVHPVEQKRGLRDKGALIDRFVVKAKMMLLPTYGKSSRILSTGTIVPENK